MAGAYRGDHLVYVGNIGTYGPDMVSRNVVVFLGIRDDYYSLPWQSLKYDTGLRGYISGATSDKLNGAPGTPRKRVGAGLIPLARSRSTSTGQR
jgi:hypothetical protein